MRAMIHGLGQAVRKSGRDTESPADTNRQNSSILVLWDGGILLDKHKIFLRNLEAIRKINGQSLAEFAKEAGIPKSTLQSVRVNGSTTLDTAIRIADALGLPLDSLIGDEQMPRKADLVQHILTSVGWFQGLSSGEQEEVLLHFCRILEVVCK